MYYQLISKIYNFLEYDIYKYKIYKNLARLIIALEDMTVSVKSELLQT